MNRLGKSASQTIRYNMNILFVCTGNTCRSPMAEGIFKDMLKKTILTILRSLLQG